MIRIKSIEIINCYNIPYGKLEIDSVWGKDVLAIFGENGSGKTSLIKILKMISVLMKGKSILEFSDCLKNSSNKKCSIEIVFSLMQKKNEKLVSYKLELINKENILFHICKEILKVKEEKDNEFKELIRNEYGTFSELDNIDLNKKIQTIEHDNFMMKANSYFDYIKGISLLFGKQELLKMRNEKKELKEANEIINELKNFAENQFLVLLNNEYNFQLCNAFLGKERIISLVERSLINKDELSELVKVVRRYNVLLGALIPGLEIDLQIIKEKEINEYELGVEIEMIAVRDGNELPLRNESNGIKKIISLFPYLINIYNRKDYTLVVDDFDMNTHEYLLGEIVGVLKDFGEGQLIFSFNNLRILEILDRNSTIISSSGRNNRYEIFKGIKKENLRDKFYKEKTTEENYINSDICNSFIKISNLEKNMRAHNK